jgi:hypothetical protein
MYLHPSIKPIDVLYYEVRSGTMAPRLVLVRDAVPRDGCRPSIGSLYSRVFVLLSSFVICHAFLSEPNSGQG